MSDGEKGRVTGEKLDARLGQFSAAMIHRLQDQVKAVHQENARLEEAIRREQQRVKALERERIRLTSERNRHRAAMSHCYRGIQTMLKALEDHLGGVAAIEKSTPSPATENSPKPPKQAVAASPLPPRSPPQLETTVPDEDAESELDEELCSLVQTTQDYVSDMRKIDQLLMASSSVSSS